MGSYRLNGFRSRAGNSGTEKGLVLQGETSRERVAEQFIQQSSVILDTLFVIFPSVRVLKQ